MIHTPLPAHRDSGQGQCADRGVRGHSVRTCAAEGGGAPWP